MSRYRIVHTTGFKYQGQVAASYNEARMSPMRDDSQIVFSSKIDVQPQASTHEFRDFFGSRAMMFEVLQPHSEMTITATSLVEIRSNKVVEPAFTWDEISAQLDRSLELTDAVTQTRRTAPPAELSKFAKKLAATNGPHQTAMAICRKIFASMTYQHGYTGVKSVAAEAWSAKTGVCQDYAHIALGALRAVGIPARYVSGYLHPAIEPALHEKVIGESHAWVEWWAGSWFAFDPTNDVFVAERHVTVGRGRDYDDVPPLRGVYAGPFAGELFVSVEITREA